MSLDKKQKIDLIENVISQIDIASETLLLKYSGNENVMKMVNQTRETMVAKLKEIERNLSNNEQKYVYFFQVYKLLIYDSLECNLESENLLGILVIVNQDFSHLFKNSLHILDLRNAENLSALQIYLKYFIQSQKEKLTFDDFVSFKDTIQCEILANLIEIENSIIIDLSNPLDNVLESIKIYTETIEYDDCVSGLLNVDKVKNLKVGIQKASTISDEFFGIFKNLEKLVLYPRDLSAFKKENFSSLKNLINLRINYNRKISFINKDTFLGLNKLKTLSLDYNKIQDINSEMFNGLENLVTLSIANNCLTRIENDTFVHLKNLLNLKLTNNQIQKLVNGCFNGLDKLETIKLDNFNNDTIIIEKNVFDTCPNLECLDLSCYKIDQLNELKFKHAGSLKILGLSGRSINDSINFIRQFKNLQCLLIKNIFEEDNYDIIFLNDMKTIVLECYQYPKLGKNFQNLRALNILVKNDNLFDTNYFDNLESLDYLSLFFKRLDSLQKLNEKHFEKLKNLKYLKITLYGCSFTRLKQLREFFFITNNLCKNVFDEKKIEYKFLNEENFNINHYCLNAEFKVCESSEVNYEKYLNISPQSREFLMNEFNIDK